MLHYSRKKRMEKELSSFFFLCNLFRENLMTALTPLYSWRGCTCVDLKKGETQVDEKNLLFLSNYIIFDVPSDSCFTQSEITDFAIAFFGGVYPEGSIFKMHMRAESFPHCAIT